MIQNTSLEFLTPVYTLLFLIGLSGILFYRRNVLVLLISIELILLAVNFIFILTSIRLDDIIGQILALYILTVAAGESAIGLALLVAFFAIRGSIQLSYLTFLKL